MYSLSNSVLDLHAVRIHLLSDFDHRRDFTHLNTGIHFKEEKLPRIIVHEKFYRTWMTISMI
jgi:hypothetical protein